MENFCVIESCERYGKQENFDCIQHNAEIALKGLDGRRKFANDLDLAVKNLENALEVSERAMNDLQKTINESHKSLRALRDARAALQSIEANSSQIAMKQVIEHHKSKKARNLIRIIS
jgi:adenylyl- and sulfurtransferase ThiI